MQGGDAARRTQHLEEQEGKEEARLLPIQRDRRRPSHPDGVSDKVDTSTPPGSNRKGVNRSA